MPTRAFCPRATLETGQQVQGFRVTQVDAIPEIRATAYQLLHGRTGLKALHLHCEDRENLYAIVLRTPPPDSTGIAHILEHCTLAGSERYPLKDVFNELRRGTLTTFINAFTAPDFTCYPVGSQVRADFYNLATVYTDLVLRPLLARTTFMREGHHFEFDERARLTISGIVYNEMKGAFSTPERIGQALTIQSLFPGTPYGVESGGRPEAIPDLTYDAFRDFHRRFYSPTNARVFLYGDIPTRDHLEFLAAQLDGWGAIDVDSRVPRVARWSAARVVADSFPVGADDPLERRTTVNVAWLAAPAADLEERLKLEVLQEALVGNPAAPLRKALIDSGLGEDLSPNTGLITWYQEMPFSVGLRGTEPERAEPIEQLIRETLERLVTEGLERDLLEGAIHQVEFKGLEITREGTPFSLRLLFRLLSSWLHDHDPLVPLTFPTLMTRLRTAWEADPRIFERAIQQWLVVNPHRVRATIQPSRTLAAERETALRQRLDAQLAAMTGAEVAAVRADMELLRAEQQGGTDPADIARLPRLELAEIPLEIERIAATLREVDGVAVHEHDLFSNGICYLDMAFDVADVPEELQPYLPLLGAAATGMGAAGADYASFATRKALVTGAVEAELAAFERVDGRPDAHMLLLHASCLERNAAAMVSVVRDILTAGDLTDLGRLRDILSEQRNSLRAHVAPAGHLYAQRAAAAALSDAAWREEQWHGAPQIRFLAGLARQFDERANEIRTRLVWLRGHVLRRGRMIVNLTGDEACLSSLRGPVAELIAAVPAGNAPAAPTLPDRRRIDRGIAIPGEVTYVARVAPVAGYTSEHAPRLWLLANHLRTGFLYEKIRVEGGAYGGVCSYSPTAGHFAMLSYRDPHLVRTLETYDAAVGGLLARELGPDELRTAIIGAMGMLDRPLDPWQKGRTALVRSLQGLTDDLRQHFRQGIMSANGEGLRACAEQVLVPAMDAAGQAVCAARERIEEANTRLARPFVVETLE
jgi:presequence protease